MANFSDLPREIKHLVLSQNPDALRVAQRLNRETYNLTQQDYFRYHCHKPITPFELLQYLNTYPERFGYYSVAETENGGWYPEFHTFGHRLGLDINRYYHYVTFIGRPINMMSFDVKIENGVVYSEYGDEPINIISLLKEHPEEFWLDPLTEFQIYLRRKPCSKINKWPTTAKNLAIKSLKNRYEITYDNNSGSYLFRLNIYGAYLNLINVVLQIDHYPRIYYVNPDPAIIREQINAIKSEIEKRLTIIITKLETV